MMRAAVRALVRRALGTVVVLVLAVGCAESSSTPAPQPSPSAAPDGSDLARSAVVVEGMTCGLASLGSGVVTADGILTNAHVVAGIEELTVRTADGPAHPATVVAFDPETDLAVLLSPDLDAQGEQWRRSGLPVRVDVLPDRAVGHGSPYASDEAVLIRPDGFIASRWPLDQEPPDIAPLVTGSAS